MKIASLTREDFDISLPVRVKPETFVVARTIYIDLIL